MTQTDDLSFLPRPAHVERAGGTFPLSAATRLQIGPAASDETLHAARGLQAALADLFALPAAIQKVEAPQPGYAVTLVLVGRDAGAFPADEFGWDDPSQLGAEGYTLQVGPAGAAVAANDEAGLFYGVQTLIQLAKLTGREWPGLRIADRPVLPVRGLMLDVSRAKVPTMAWLTRLVTTLAHYKYNQFQLYIEHTFRFPSHPKIGADAGAYTSDDMLALDAHCRANHVELVPNLQSLGHQRATLNLPEYSHLAETPWNWTLATNRDETFQLLDELYGDMLPAFTSRWFNVDADEPYDQGLGQSAKLTEAVGHGRVYLHHILRLHELVTKHDHRMMMWADMLKHYRDVATELPDDILLLDWEYEPKAHYDTVDALAQAKRRFYVCPGTSSWSSLFPRLDNAITNIRTLVKDGIAAGTEGMLLTDWGDHGHYQQMSHSWYPYLWGAETGWTGGKTESPQFDAAFGRLFLGDASGRLTAALRRLGSTMSVSPQWFTSWNTAMALLNDPIAGTMAEIATPEQVGATRDAAEALQPLLPLFQDDGIRADLAFTVDQILFACDKVETTRASRALLTRLAEEGGPTDEGRDALDAQIAALRAKRDALPAMIAEFEARWLAQARPSEIAINLARLVALRARYDAAIAWLEEQRQSYAHGGKVDANLTTYDVGGYGTIIEESVRNTQNLIDIVGFDALPPDLRGSFERRRSQSADAADSAA